MRNTSIRYNEIYRQKQFNVHFRPLSKLIHFSISYNINLAVCQYSVDTSGQKIIFCYPIYFKPYYQYFIFFIHSNTRLFGPRCIFLYTSVLGLLPEWKKNCFKKRRKITGKIGVPMKYVAIIRG